MNIKRSNTLNIKDSLSAFIFIAEFVNFNVFNAILLAAYIKTNKIIIFIIKLNINY